MAPEALLKRGYTFFIDYWAATVVLYYMLTGKVRLYPDTTTLELPLISFVAAVLSQEARSDKADGL